MNDAPLLSYRRLAEGGCRLWGVESKLVVFSAFLTVVRARTRVHKQLLWKYLTTEGLPRQLSLSAERRVLTFTLNAAGVLKVSVCSG